MEGVFEKKDGDRGANSIPTKQRQNMHALWNQILGEGAQRTTDRDRTDCSVYPGWFGSAGLAWEEGKAAIEHVCTPEVSDPMNNVAHGLIEKP
jgi:hypothetical protein